LPSFCSKNTALWAWDFWLQLPVSFYLSIASTVRLYVASYFLNVAEPFVQGALLP